MLIFLHSCSQPPRPPAIGDVYAPGAARRAFCAPLPAHAPVARSVLALDDDRLPTGSHQDRGCRCRRFVAISDATSESGAAKDIAIAPTRFAIGLPGYARAAQKYRGSIGCDL